MRLSNARSIDSVNQKMAEVVEILIAKSPADPAISVERALAVPGSGLEGDRYAEGHGTSSYHPQRPDGELTLIQKEHIDAFAAATGKIISCERDDLRSLRSESM